MADEGYLTPRLIAWKRRTDGPLLALAIGSLPILLLEVARSDLTTPDQRFLDVMNLLVLAAFAVDYVVELSLARDRRLYVRAEWSSLLIVVSQGLAVVPALSGAGALRVLRIGRAGRPVLVVIRALAIGGAASREGRTLLRRHAAGFALGVAGMTWISSAVAFTLLEDNGGLRRCLPRHRCRTRRGRHHHGRRDQHLRRRDGEGG